MTALLDPPSPLLTLDEALAPDDPTPARPRVALAALAAGAGAIHLAMAPSHADGSTVEGLAFAAGGIVQLALAAGLLLRPGRAVVRAAVAVSVALAAGWAWSRTAGLPWGAHAGESEDVGFVDGVATGLEVALVAGAALGARWRGGRALATVVPLAVVGLVAAALVSPSARDHAAGSHGGHEKVATDDGFAALANGHAEHHVEPVALDAATQAELDAQLAVTRTVAERYPTVQDAVDGGYFRAGPYVPGIGAHYLKISGESMNADDVMSQADLESPMAIIYRGNAPGDEIAGFMYYSASEAAPEGFAGPNDAWHFHEQLCMVRSEAGIDFPFGPDKAATPDQCDAVGGMLIDQSQWMVHVWSVPGWDRFDGGVFAEYHPGLDCSDGTYHMVPPEAWAGRLNVCRSAVG